MKYVFVCPEFISQLYFCFHDGAGFTLSNRIEEALVSSDADSAAKEGERLRQQSGFMVQARVVDPIYGRNMRNDVLAKVDDKF